MIRRSRLLVALAVLGSITACGPVSSTRNAPAPTESGPAVATAPVAAQATMPSGARQGRWWSDRVFYEIFVRSFADSSSGPLANDGIGDFAGLTERLDYLNDGNPATTTDLGITGIWLMPINPSPSYHGYDVTDYYGVNPQYGTSADFKRFLDECHRRGIRVIVDLVLNHSSSQHPWFQKALAGDRRYRDRYIFVPADKVPDVLGPWNQIVWQTMQGQHYFGLFWSGMPDLNYRNPDVTAEAYRIADFWLRDMQVDGFRLDAVRHLIEDGDVMVDTPETIAWLTAFEAHLRTVRPDVMTVGEVWTTTDVVSRYIDAEALDLAFEFDLAGAFLDAARSGDKIKLAYHLQDSAENFHDQRFASFITNHDQDRVMSELGGDITRAKLAAALLLTSPGVPFIYYGEEIGQKGRKPDEMIRTPMQWTAGPNGGFSAAPKPWERLQKGYEQTNVQAQTADPQSLLSQYRRLIRLREASPALQRGAVQLVETGRDDVIAYARALDGKRVLVVANLGKEPIAWPASLDAATAGLTRDVLSDTAVADARTGGLRALAAYVFE